MGRITLVSGGIRSGKSSMVQDRLLQAEKPGIIVTGKATDAEMQRRIDRHKADRPNKITTIEACDKLDEIIQSVDFDVLGIDCIGTWITNRMWDLGLNFDHPSDSECVTIGQTIEEEAHKMISAAIKSSADVWIVTNEVGFSLIPATKSSRLFTDTIGRINKAIASSANDVFLVCCGIPVKIK